MGSKKNRTKKQSFRSSRQRTTAHNPLQYQSLELRQLLAGDLIAGAAFDVAPVHNVFSHDAVTLAQMIERAEHRPFIADQLVVAVELEASSIEAAATLEDLNWQIMVGSDSVQPLRTMMTIDTTATASVSLVHLDLGEGSDIFAAMTQLDDDPSVFWSSPNFYQLEDPIEYTPNDPQYGNQYHHPLMQNDDAWDFTLGDSSIVLGITDDGVDLDHEDLVSNIWINSGEIAGNGIDDDGNGYIDDVTGWDFANDNNNPDPDQSGHDHGTHVAGIAAGDTDNGLGIAGVSGGSTIMPIQWYRYDSAAWTAAVINESFVYATDNGADIVSTSYNMDGWVGDPVVTAGYQYMHDNGLIHFNSAGNGSSANPPRQAFEQTLLVVSTDSNDVKSGFSNYGTGVDISAPGSDVLSATLNDTYGLKSGTSMAAPNAAGAAALIWSQNPTWNRDQVVAQLLGTADNIDGNNPGIAGLLGAGRANTFNAMSQTLAAPQVESLVGLPDDGQSTTDLDIDGFNIRFDQYLDPSTANDAANYSVVNAGPDGTFGTADDQNIPVALASEYMIGSNGSSIEFVNGPLGFGDYRVSIVSDGLANPFGTGLDGNGDTTPGDDFVLEFSIIPPPPESIGPEGSLIYERAFFDSLNDAGEVDSFSIELDPGQTLSTTVVGPSGMNPNISITDPNGIVIADTTGVGEYGIVDSAPANIAGTYLVNVNSESNLVGGYSVSILINSGLEVESFGGGDNNTMANGEDINGTSIALGGGADRLAVLGELPSSLGTQVDGDNLDTGALDTRWTSSSSDGQGRIQVTGDFGTAGGAAALVMDVAIDSTPNLNEAIWSVDLTGISDPILSFYHADWSDEEEPLPASFTGSVNGDGVSVSDDGVNWYTILNAPDVAFGTWEQSVHNLNDVATQFGLTLGANFQVKFQQFDNFALTTDGRGYDEIQILVPDPSDDWYNFDLDDGQVATIAATGQASNGTIAIELYDNAGNLLESGVDGTNVSSFVQQYADSTSNSAADTYHVRVIGANTDYSLLVLRDADFDLEPNNNDTEAQDISDVLGALGFVSAQQDIAAEPDDFASGAILDTAVEGVTLSNEFGGGSVFAATAGFGAPTGTLVFGPTASTPQGWSDFDNELRADFDQQQSTVSIDVGSDDTSDVAYLRAYDSNGVLLDEVISGSISSGGSETITITRPTADIAYILAAGLGTDVTPLDNLQFSTIGTDDYYSLDAQVGEVISLNGVLPGEGPFFIDNGLDTDTGSDLILEIYDPTNALVASGNEAVSYTATMDGSHQVRVSSAGGGGEYYLQRVLGPNVPAGIDFGPEGSPIWPTYAGVSDEVYVSTVGYGWQLTSGLLPFEGNRGNDLTRDKVSMRTGTFVIDVPDGMYAIDIYLGQVRKTDAIEITIEGNADMFTPQPGPNVVRSYMTTVSDGQLTIDFDGLAGLNNTIQVAGIGLEEADGRPAQTGKTGISSPELNSYWHSSSVATFEGATDSLVPRASESGSTYSSPVVIDRLDGSHVTPIRRAVELDALVSQDSFADFDLDLEVVEFLENSLQEDITDLKIRI